MERFGDSLPWTEPYWYTGIPSPYYTPKHAAFRNFLRDWLDKNLSEDNTGDAYRKLADIGLLLPIGAGLRIPKELWRFWVLPTVQANEWDGFYDLIMWDEMYRKITLLPGGVSGLVVGLPPLLHYGSSELKERTLPDLLSGKKQICFAVTEPDGGSDIKNITTTAIKSADGSHFIVTGEKKWITNGGNADFLTTLVRTGGPGISGLSVLLVPLSPSIQTRPMALSPDGQQSTVYVTFDDAPVPASNLIGTSGQGFRYVVNNFNHERLLVAYQSLSLCRTSLHDTLTWALKRETFGKRLVEQPIVRWKFSQMARQVEALQAWTEQILYAACHLDPEKANERLGGTTALLKGEAGKVVKYVADECQKLFGGLGMTRTGQGAFVEAAVRRVPLLVVPGGSEDVLLDFGTREALKRAGVQIGIKSSL